MTLKQAIRNDTVFMSFEVVHDPDDDTRYDIEWTTYNWHKPIRVEARWAFKPDFDEPWTLLDVAVHAKLREREKGRIARKSPLFRLSYAAHGTKYDNMQRLPAWLAEDLAACTPTHDPAHAAEDDRCTCTDSVHSFTGWCPSLGDPHYSFCPRRRTTTDES